MTAVAEMTSPKRPTGEPVPPGSPAGSPPPPSRHQERPARPVDALAHRGHRSRSPPQRRPVDGLGLHAVRLGRWHRARWRLRHHRRCRWVRERRQRFTRARANRRHRHLERVRPLRGDGGIPVRANRFEARRPGVVPPAAGLVRAGLRIERHRRGLPEPGAGFERLPLAQAARRPVPTFVGIAQRVVSRIPVAAWLGYPAEGVIGEVALLAARTVPLVVAVARPGPVPTRRGRPGSCDVRPRSRTVCHRSIGTPPKAARMLVYRTILRARYHKRRMIGSLSTVVADIHRWIFGGWWGAAGGSTVSA